MLLAISDSQNWLLRCFAALASADDQGLRWLLVLACLDAFLVAPRIDDVATTARATTVRVIHRVHHFAANLRALAEPATLAGLAVRHQLVLGVAYGADSRQAVSMNHARLGRGHAESDVVTFLGDDFQRSSRRARHLAALAGLQLDVVHVGTERNLLERQRVADAAVGAWP